MFGLANDDWRDLVLSVNVHRKNRRLSPVRAAQLVELALANTDIDTLSHALGFDDTTTLKKIHRLHLLPAELAPTIEWGTRKGSVSMSTAAELLRLEEPGAIRTAIAGAIEYNLTREEARQVVQIHERTSQPVAECLKRALATRPRIERSELILGSLVTQKARQVASASGDEAVTRRLKTLLAHTFPGVIVQSVRVTGQRFSLLLSEADAAGLRGLLNSRSIEATVTGLIETITFETAG